jgi:hypothetical protein
MEKVHGPAIEAPIHARHGHLDQPAVIALAISLALLLIIGALVIFGSIGTQ